MKRGAEWRATAALLAASALTALFGYLWTLVAARFLPRSDYADFVAAASILFFVVIALGPISQSVAYFVAHGAGAALPRATERRVIVCGAVAVALIVGASGPLSHTLAFSSALPLIGVAICAFVIAILSIRRGVLQGESRFIAYSNNVAIESLLRLAAIVAVGFFLPTAFAGMMTYVGSAIVALLMLRLPGSSEKTDLRPFFRFLAPAFAYTSVYGALLNSDVVFAKFLFPTSDAAVYGAASFLSRAAAVFVMPFYVMAVPRMLEARHDAADMRRRGRRILLQYGALALAAVIVLGVGRRFFIAVLIGHEYDAAAPLIVPLSIAIALEGFVFLLCQIPVARGDFRFVPWYAAGYVIELLAVMIWHSTPLSMACAIIGAQTATMILVALTFLRGTPLRY